MALPSISVVAGQGGLGRRSPSKDGVCGLATTGVATTATSTTLAYTLGTSLKLLSLRDAERYGINEAYDASNEVVIWYHIKEFFRMSPNGVLWLGIYARTNTMAIIADNTNNFAKKLLQDAEGEIRTLAISRNPSSGYTPTIVAGFDDDMHDAVDAAVVLASEEAVLHRPINIVIEGRSFSGSASAARDYRDLDTSANVSIVIGQDKGLTLSGEQRDMASVGTVLGTISKAKVSENIAWTERFRLDDAYNWVTPAIVYGSALSTVNDADQATLHDKGYILPRKHVGYPGVYWNNANNLASLSSDYAFIHLARVWNKAAREIYTAVIPRLNAPVQLDSSGQLSPESIASFESAARRPLDQMQTQEEISAYGLFVDPNQDVLTTNKVTIRVRIIPIGDAQTIEVDLGYSLTI